MVSEEDGFTLSPSLGISSPVSLDRSLVSPLLDDAQSDAIVATITNLGQSLSLPVTAEGVETSAIRDRLESIGCTDAQGWLFGRAVPAETIAAMLRESSGDSSEGDVSQPAPESNPRRRSA